MQEKPVKHNPYLHDLVWDLLKDNPPGRLLDIPSGPGYFTQQANKHNFDSIAAEIDDTLHIFPDVTYRKVNMSVEFPFEIESFDYIISIEGIEHIENQFLFLRECSRILKTGGKLFLTTPNASSLKTRFTSLFNDFHGEPPRPIKEDQPNIYMEHINIIPFHRLETFLRFAGFKIHTLTTHRFRLGSKLLFPLVYPFAFYSYYKTYRKFFKGKQDDELYWSIYKKYLSKKVLCGDHIIIIAVKE